jgi:hypothetical protein
MAELKTRYETLSGAGPAENHWERYGIEVAMQQIQEKIAAIEAGTNDLLEAAQFGGYC